MSKHLNRAREYQRAIKKILMDEWDPIGVKDMPEAHDEYDAYISRVYVLLIRHEPETAIFDYLWDIEVDHMGLFGNRTRTDQVVRSLLELREQMEKAC